MKLSLLASLTVVSVCLPTWTHAQSYFLKPYQAAPGQTVVARSSSDASGGEITVINSGIVKKGILTVKRKRTFERRVVGTGPTAKLEYVVLIDQTYRSTKLGDKSNESSTRGGLTGQIVYGLRDDMNRWRLFLKGKTATNRQAVELVELECYENRQWFQKSPVKVGDTWFIEPSFIRNFIERDMGPALIEATMTFKAIQTIDGEKTAVLNFSIKSQSRKEDDASLRTSSAIANLNGTLYVSLTTMLDKKLTMTGTLTTTVRQSGVSSVIKSPVTYIVTKSLR